MVTKESQVSETSCFYRGTHRLILNIYLGLMSKSEEKISYGIFNGNFDYTVFYF